MEVLEAKKTKRLRERSMDSMFTTWLQKAFQPKTTLSFSFLDTQNFAVVNHVLCLSHVKDKTLHKSSLPHNWKQPMWNVALSSKSQQQSVTGYGCCSRGERGNFLALSVVVPAKFEFESVLPSGFLWIVHFGEIQVFLYCGDRKYALSFIRIVGFELSRYHCTSSHSFPDFSPQQWMTVSGLCFGGGSWRAV